MVLFSSMVRAGAGARAGARTGTRYRSGRPKVLLIFGLWMDNDVLTN